MRSQLNTPPVLPQLNTPPVLPLKCASPVTTVSKANTAPSLLLCCSAQSTLLPRGFLEHSRHACLLHVIAGAVTKKQRPCNVKKDQTQCAKGLAPQQVSCYSAQRSRHPDMAPRWEGDEVGRELPPPTTLPQHTMLNTQCWTANLCAHARLPTMRPLHITHVPCNGDHNNMSCQEIS